MMIVSLCLELNEAVSAQTNIDALVSAENELLN